MKPWDIKISLLAIHRVKILHATLFHLILATTTSLAGGQTGSGSGMMESSSLFVASQDISTDGWEQYKTESLPSEDLNQCLARCMLHQKQWSDGLHSGWVRKLPEISNSKDLNNEPFFQRCNAVFFESELCEEAHITQLQVSHIKVHQVSHIR